VRALGVCWTAQSLSQSRSRCEYLRQFDRRRIEQPALFIGGERDLMLAMLGRGDLVAIMKTEVPNVMVADFLPGCGH
jgi:pimeloyl-ACP methyl ester carboxylesterase